MDEKAWTNKLHFPKVVARWAYYIMEPIELNYHIKNLRDNFAGTAGGGGGAQNFGFARGRRKGMMTAARHLAGMNRIDGWLHTCWYHQIFASEPPPVHALFLVLEEICSTPSEWSNKCSTGFMSGLKEGHGSTRMSLHCMKFGVADANAVEHYFVAEQDEDLHFVRSRRHFLTQLRCFERRLGPPTDWAKF